MKFTTQFLKEKKITYTIPNKTTTCPRLIADLVQWALMVIAMMLVCTILAPLVLDASEREAQWRADRLCRIYGVCDPKSGP